MRIEVLLFAAAKDAAGADSIPLEVADNPCAADVLEALGGAIPEMLPLLGACRLAVNSCYVADQTNIQATDEVALIPPVSGG